MSVFRNLVFASLLPYAHCVSLSLGSEYWKKRKSVAVVGNDDPSIEPEEKAFKSDKSTAFGSVLDSKTDLPVTTIGLGFAECGTDMLGQILSKHPGAIVGSDPKKNFFTSKKMGSCKRKRALKGTTLFEQFIWGCFKGKVPKRGQTVIDISDDYGMYSWSGVVSDLEKMKNETTLRFLAVVCDPRERALRAITKENDTAENRDFEQLSHNAAHALMIHKKTGFSSTIAIGQYMKMLGEWNNHFPQSSMMIVNSKALKDLDAWKRIFLHLGLNVPKQRTMMKWFEEAKETKKQKILKHMSHTVQKRLRNEYNDTDTALWEMIGIKWW